MTVYEFLLHAARSYSGVVNGGKTEEIRIDLTRKSIWSGRLPIMREGKLLLKSVRLENGEVCKYLRREAEGPEIPVLWAERFELRDYVKPFDLERDLLCRFAVIVTPAEKLLFLDVHHVIFDGLSFGILTRQIDEAYNGLPVEPEGFTANDYAL